MSKQVAERLENLSPEEQRILLAQLLQRKAPKPKKVSLSFAQERLWFIDQLEPGSPAYNLPIAVRLTGQLDVAALAQSLDEIVRRHETLRTTFAAVDGHPTQVIALFLALPLRLVDLEHLPEAEREAEAQRLIATEAQRPFDLTRGPLLRATLLKLKTHHATRDTDHILLITMHHIVSDAWSMGVLIREVAALYRAFSTGESSPLPELPIQYADFGVWQREWLQRKVMKGVIWQHFPSGLAGIQRNSQLS